MTTSAAARSYTTPGDVNVPVDPCLDADPGRRKLGESIVPVRQKTEAAAERVHGSSVHGGGILKPLTQILCLLAQKGEGHISRGLGLAGRCYRRFQRNDGFRIMPARNAHGGQIRLCLSERSRQIGGISSHTIALRGDPGERVRITPPCLARGG